MNMKVCPSATALTLGATSAFSQPRKYVWTQDHKPESFSPYKPLVLRHHVDVQRFSDRGFRREIMMGRSGSTAEFLGFRYRFPVKT